MSSRHIVVTGGAGFIGSHLCRALIDRGDYVTAIDNLSTGHSENLTGIDHHRFVLQIDDVCTATAFTDLVEVTAIVHLACPASPKANSAMPIDTLRAATVGTLNVLECARQFGARAVIVSSSEIYGDPQVHPQTADYRGNANPVGVHSAYTEGKRASEAATAAYHRQGIDCGIVRPFNVYGPRMQPEDGRVVPAFCAAALAGETLKLDGGGTQTRSLTYIDDFVTGLVTMLDSSEFGPVNLGSDTEVSIRQLGELVVELAGTGALEIAPERDDDVVTVRRPDISKARSLLSWQPQTNLSEGIDRTLGWMRAVMES